MEKFFNSFIGWHEFVLVSFCLCGILIAVWCYIPRLSGHTSHLSAVQAMHTQPTPWAILLTMFLPVANMLLAIYRWSKRNSLAMAPDRLHVHQLVMRALEICVLGRGRRKTVNPLSTSILAPFIIAPPIAGVIFWDQLLMAFISIVIFGLPFFGFYMLSLALIRLFRRQ